MLVYWFYGIERAVNNVNWRIVLSWNNNFLQKGWRTLSGTVATKNRYATSFRLYRFKCTIQRKLSTILSLSILFNFSFGCYVENSIAGTGIWQKIVWGRVPLNILCPIDSFFTVEKYKWRSNESHESTPNENPIILDPGWNSMEPDEIMIRCNFAPIVPIKWMLHLGSCQLSEQYLIQRTT